MTSAESHAALEHRRACWLWRKRTFIFEAPGVKRRTPSVPKPGLAQGEKLLNAPHSLSRQKGGPQLPERMRPAEFCVQRRPGHSTETELRCDMGGFAHSFANSVTKPSRGDKICWGFLARLGLCSHRGNRPFPKNTLTKFLPVMHMITTDTRR